MEQFPTTNDLTKEDWVEILKKGNWNVNYEQKELAKFLQCSTIDNITVTTEIVSTAMGYVVRFSAKDFFIEEGFKVVKTTELAHDGEYSPSYKNIEYATGKVKNCLSDGYYFLEKDSLKYVYRTQQGHDGVYFYIYANRDTIPESGVILEKLLKYSKKHNYLKGQKIDPQCNIIPLDRKYSWEDLVLSDERKDDIRRNLSNLIRYSELYKKNNLQVKRGLVFHGKPGTGKTLLGKILCSTIDWTFLWVTPKYLQDSRDVTKVMDICRELSPTILFLEDMDLYGGSRDQNANLGVLGELMNSLDGIKENSNIITIATTNDKEKLEKALLNRPGRFDRVIEFEEPDKASILRMLKLFTKDVVVDKAVNMEGLAEHLLGLTGAQIRELISLSMLYAIDEKTFDKDEKIVIRNKHIKEAFPSIKSKDYTSVGFSKENDTAYGCPWDIDD